MFEPVWQRPSFGLAGCLLAMTLSGCITDATNRTDSTFEVDEPESTHKHESVRCHSGLCYYSFETSLATIDQWRHLDPERWHDEDSRFAYQVEIRPRARRDDRLGRLGDQLEQFEDGDTAFFGLRAPFSSGPARVFECGPNRKEKLRRLLGAEDGQEVHYTWRFDDYVVQCDWPDLVFTIDREPTVDAKGRTHCKSLEVNEDGGRDVDNDQIPRAEDPTAVLEILS
ncbi:MAG: hypothetical protein ABEN55_08890 [Bradymonadaceae bacterium]